MAASCVHYFYFSLSLQQGSLFLFAWITVCILFFFNKCLTMRYLSLLFIQKHMFFMNIPAGICASVRTCPLVPTYRLNPGVHQLLSVLARQLAEAQDGLPLLVAGVGRISEVLCPLHQCLQLAAHALGRQGVQVLPQALHAALQERRGGVGNMESLREHLKDC